jgi:hypothetical protein
MGWVVMIHWEEGTEIGKRDLGDSFGQVPREGNRKIVLCQPLLSGDCCLWLEELRLGGPYLTTFLCKATAGSSSDFARAHCRVFSSVSHLNLPPDSRGRDVVLRMLPERAS